jgi:hypothetical protein
MISPVNQKIKGRKDEKIKTLVVSRQRQLPLGVNIVCIFLLKEAFRGSASSASNPGGCREPITPSDRFFGSTTT